jgi:glucose-6-phosphate 1-epimerase
VKGTVLPCPTSLIQELREDAKTLEITSATDRVYEASPPETTVLGYKKGLFTLHRDNFKDVVVWNPWSEGVESMGDFEPKSGWKNMVCPIERN